MSGKCLSALPFLLFAGALAHAQCPIPNNSACQPQVCVSKTVASRCCPNIVYPTCGIPQSSVVVSHWQNVIETPISAVHYPSPNMYQSPNVVVSHVAPGCGTCASAPQGVATYQVVQSPTQVSDSVVKATPSKCACTLRDISSTNGTASRAMNSIVERPDGSTKGPFSEVGHVRPDSGRAIPNPCEIEFYECCAAGGKNCAAKYAACADLTGEKVKHALCPEDVPDPTASPKPESPENTEKTSSK